MKGNLEIVMCSSYFSCREASGHAENINLKNCKSQYTLMKKVNIFFHL